jgi:ferredoxin
MLPDRPSIDATGAGLEGRMVQINYRAEVIPEKCTGCVDCVFVCPTLAIKMENRKAVVDESKCVACQNCIGICGDDAIVKLERPEPVEREVDYTSVDQDRILEICRRARIHPMQWLCLCTSTRAREGAAAIIQGAKTAEDMALLTGTRSGCTVYCAMMSMRLLKAAGINLPPSHKWHLFDTTQSIWDVPKDVVEKYSDYFLEEDKEVFRKF